MAIIDPKGLFLGDRLSRCSDLAQLHWTRLYSAANNYARLELNYRKVVAAAYSSFKVEPTESQFWGWIREYKDEGLLFVYEVNGVPWGQWQTNDRYLLGHKNAEDRRSPSPPGEDQEKYRQTYAARKKQRALQNQGFADLLGVVPSRTELDGNGFAGVGGGVGEGIKLEPKGSSPPTPRPEEFANAWNMHRGSLPKVQEFTESRRKKVQARIRQGVTLERFAEAVKACTTMPFLLGTNRNGWIATFDWLVENDRNLAKVLEGNYRETGGNRGTHQFSSPTLEREQRSNSAIADARATLRRNLGFDGADEEQLSGPGDQPFDGPCVDGTLVEASERTRPAKVPVDPLKTF